MNKIKILFINGGIMDRGGISSFICNYLKYFNFNIFEVHVAVHGDLVGSRNMDIERLGCKIYYLPIKSKSFIKWTKELTDIMEINQYDIVHSNADAGNGLILKIAKKCNIPVRISHSHNTQFLTKNKIKIILNKYQRKQIKKYATHLFACSELAGKWLYGKYNFEVINNAIDYDLFVFNEMQRKKIRDKLNIDKNTYVIGHVGRFDYQKNHYFILKLAKLLKKENIIFLLIGEGHLKKEIEREIVRENLNNIILTGEIKNVSEYLNAMDCFILPSLFEGLSVVSIEAQVNGLKCLFSDTITKESCISSKTIFLSINQISLWKEMLLKMKNDIHMNRKIELNDNYNLKVQSNNLQKKYIGFIKEVRNEN